MPSLAEHNVSGQPASGAPIHQPPEETDAYASEDQLFVHDPTCSQAHPERVHEIIVDGRVVHYTFKVEEYGRQLMPFSHAMKFLKAGFKVTRADGNEFRSLPTNTDPNTGGIPRLEPDQCVANLEELTGHALVARANTYSGGEKYKAGTKKSELIRFIVAKEEERRRENTAPDETATIAPGEQMSDKELDALFAEAE